MLLSWCKWDLASHVIVIRLEGYMTLNDWLWHYWFILSLNGVHWLRELQEGVTGRHGLRDEVDLLMLKGHHTHDVLLTLIE